MPGSVSGSNGANAALSTGWKQASPYLQKLGLDSKFSTQIGNILNGNTDAMITNTTDGVVDNLVSNPVANAAVKGAIDIVKTVLLGQYNKGEDIKDAKNDESALKDLASQSNAIADEGKNAGKEVLNQVQSDADEVQSNINNSVDTIKNATEEGAEEITEVSKETEATTETLEGNQATIKQNNDEIQKKQSKRDELASKIATKKAELGMSNEAPAPKPTPTPSAPGTDGNNSSVENGGENSTQTNTQLMSTDGVEDGELKALINEYNTLGADISGLQLINTNLSTKNTAMTETIQENIENTSQSVTEKMEISEEQSAYIDEQTNNIVSMANDAESAIKEVSNLLQGQFPKMDKVATVKLATSMTKSAICGTNSGLLASAAAAMGVSSVFSFGSTAAKAAELGAASGDQAAASAKHIATNVAGKIIQQQMTQYMKQTFSDIGQMIGVDLSQMSSIMDQYIQEQTAVKDEAIANFKQVAEDSSVVVADTGSDGGSSEVNNSGDSKVNDSGNLGDTKPVEKKEDAA